MPPPAHPPKERGRHAREPPYQPPSLVVCQPPLPGPPPRDPAYLFFFPARPFPRQTPHLVFFTTKGLFPISTHGVNKKLQIHGLNRRNFCLKIWKSKNCESSTFYAQTSFFCTSSCLAARSSFNIMMFFHKVDAIVPRCVLGRHWVCNFLL